jgi:cytochrome c oxidase cbb3-type subunit 3
VKVVVAVVQVFAVLCAAAFVVLLFANEPERIDPQAASEAPDGEVVVDAAAVFADRCSGCHGPDGGGGRGPQLSDGRVAAAYPDIEDQIVVVTEGRDGMPSFADRLTEDEIRAVVAFSRTL